MNDLCRYPDNGSGIYAHLLPYGDWVEFNLAQRCHQNMVESCSFILASTIVSGIFHPKISAALAFLYGLSRIVYSIGYSMNGPSGRMAGATLGFLSGITLLLLTIYSGVNSILSNK